MVNYHNGNKETVAFQEYSALILYENVEYEFYPSHWHPSIEIIMPTENSFDVTVGETDYHMEVGDILFIAPGSLHTLYAAEGRRVIILVDFSKFNTMSHAIGPLFSFIHPAVYITQTNRPDIYNRCVGLINDVRRTYAGNELFKEFDIYSSLLKLIAVVGRSYANGLPTDDLPAPDKNQLYLDRFMKVCEYIDMHYSEDLTLEGVAELAGFSKYHFERLFKNYIGVTFYKYLNRIRISQSQVLITNPDLTMTEVALRSGFNTSSSFIRMFKQFNGCTPTEYRNNYRPK